MERKNAWNTYEEADLEQVNRIAEQYRQFITGCKTERECAARIEELARAAGYVPLEKAVREEGSLQPGDKVYAVHKKKLAILYHMGTEPMERGMNILGAHIDSPRLDIKQNPLYEDG